MKEDIDSFFSKRAESYTSIGWVSDLTILNSIVKCINCHNLESSKILDLGAGTGAVSQYILDKCSGKKRIIAVDICQKMLRQIDNPLIEKYIASAEKLPFSDNEFDIIVSRQCLHYVEALNEAISEIKRVLKDDGIFVISQFVPKIGRSKNYWIELMKIRQPLRKVFFSEDEWIDCFVKNGFFLCSTEKYKKRYSIKKWSEQYNGKENNSLSRYIYLIKHAPKSYIDDYNVEFRGEDILLDANGFTASFQLLQ